MSEMEVWSNGSQEVLWYTNDHGVVEINVELWEQILALLGYERVDADPELG